MKLNNKQLIYTVAVLALFNMSSCKQDDFLDRLPQDKLTVDVLFKTENDLKLYANQFYTSLPVQYSDQDSQSDNQVPNSINSFLAGTDQVPGSGGGWSAGDWAGIRACNYFLRNNTDPALAQNIKDRYNAEVRFFRAMYYWDKVVRFGDVPIYETDLNNLSPELYNPRDPHKKVMDFVLKDLDFAVANLPESAAENRVHKYAALALKSRIALWEGTFRKYHSLGDAEVFLQAAADASLQVINSGKYEIYSTGKPDVDYNNLFIQDDLTKNKENILSRIYITNISTTNYSRGAGNGNGYSKSLIESYLCKDGKPISVSPLYAGDDTPENEVKNRDPRYPQTIATPGYIMTINENGSTDKLARPNVGTNATSTGYQIIKGRSSDVKLQNANQDNIDRFIFRYAEVLLNYAEAKAELGQLTQDILDMSVNKLRKRVGMPDMSLAGLTPDPNTPFPGISLPLQEIRRERRIELAGEGFRFRDILRWRAGEIINNPKTLLGMKLTDAYKATYPKDANGKSQVDNVLRDAQGNVRVYPNITARVWDNKMYLYPLPKDQLLLNKNFKQNPGW
ncbi:RagB/SusD family nutrient uptake outer membrane protein [Elizabethkingia anophelis]|uniref:RagB/SusD family nutrient uptake outer membrane protein n=1 Tax=Elizabethkingia anophelis TaxID=1117645 RepID=UPI00293D08F1|nr:RagB/SusD family nutrient uptake outer membrane protein [Elizabethkingia anophelis]